MRISEDSLTEVLEYVLHETDISELAEIIYGEDPAVEQIVDLARFTVESLLLECLVENHKNWLMRTHCEIGGIKKEYGKEESDNKRKIVEDSYKNWEEKFLKVFEGEFSENQELINKIRTKFKNYKFKKGNIVNDYSILFFTFCLYDTATKDCETKQCKKLAVNYAKAAYDALKRPKGKHKLNINEKKLKNFTKSLVGENFKLIYLKTFISFIRALYSSVELHDIERYLFFERFQNQIIIYNEILKVLNLFFPEGYYVKKVSRKKKIDNDKIYDSIYNETRKLNNSEDSKIKEAIKDVQHSVATFPKSTEAMQKKSIDKRLDLIYDMDENFIELLKYKDSKYEAVVEKIIEKLKNINFDNIETSVVRQNMLERFFVACSLMYKVLSSIKFNGNVFINIILFNSSVGIDAYEQSLNKIIKNIEKHTKKYIKENLELIDVNVSRKLYDDLIEFVKLDEFGLRLLNISPESRVFSYLELCV